MQKNDYQFAHHVSQMARLLYLGKASKIDEYAASLDKSTQEKLRPWLTHVLSNEYMSFLPDQYALLSDNGACAMGWQAYYQNDYLVAHNYFVQAIGEDDWQQYTLNSALGLVKTYTRTGHWKAARDWCLYYLSLARQQSCHFEVAKGYGALAEIFLRASYANEALACFQTAYHLMPLGQGQKSKQYNFMASALLRNKEFLRAEVLLHTSRQISRNTLELDPRNQDALASLCHSTMRFYYLNSLRFEGYDLVAINLSDENIIDNMNADNGLTSVPLGLLQVAKALGCLDQDVAQAESYLTQAMESFGPKLVMEYQWAARLKASCSPRLLTEDDEKLKTIFALQPVSPPAFKVVLDQTWQQIALDNHGFLPLLKAQTSGQLADLWTLFFI